MNLNPDNILKKFRKWFGNDKLRTFIIVFTIGFIANILLITNNILFTDSIVFTDVYFADQWDLSLGRWLLRPMDYFRFGLSSSVVSTIMALVFLSIAVVLIIDLFKIKSKTSKFILCCLFAAGPCFTETLFSVFCSAEFTFSFFLAILAVYLFYNIKNRKLGIFLSSLVLSASLGLYQAYLGVTCGLCVLVPLYQLLAEKKDYKKVFKDLLGLLLMGILGLIFYEIFLNIFLKIWNVSLASYSGANEVGLKTILQIPYLLKDALYSFYHYYFDDVIINNLIYNRNYVNLLLFVLIFTCIVYHYIKNTDKNKVLFNLEVIACIILIPITFGVIELIIPDRDINQLMCSQYLLIFPFAFALLKNIKIKKIFSVVSLLVFCIVTFTAQSYFVMANATYMAVRISTEKTYAASLRIVDLIESKDDYYAGMKIMFAGNPSSDYFTRTNRVYKLSSGLAASSPLIWEGAEICNRGWHNFINYYLGIDYNMVTYEEYMEIIETEEFKSMKIYPSTYSVQIINDVMVVKMLEFPSKVR